MIEHARNVSIVKYLGALQEIEKVLVDRETRFLKAGKNRCLTELGGKASKPFRVIFGSHLSEHISCGHQSSDQPFPRIAKRKFIHADGDSGGADGVLDLAKFVRIESKGRQEIPGVKTT